MPTGVHDLSGHVAVVTGANHGIGAATATLLAKRGAAVLIAYYRTYDAADPGTPATYTHNRSQDAAAVVEAIRAAGGQALSREADLGDPNSPALLLDAAQEHFGPVDILVNNASGWVQDTFQPAGTDNLGRTMQPVSAASFDAVFGVDARAVALLIGEFARRHIARGGTWGRIIGLTSGSPDGFPNEVSYGAAKAAQENYTKAAATELADHGITANIVYPPVTDTGWVTEQVRAFVATSDRHTHVASPEQVAEVIAYLASDAAELISGNTIHLR